MKILDENFYLSDDEKNEALNEDGFELNDDFLFNEKNFNTIILTQKNEQNQLQQILDVEKFIAQYQNPSEKNDLLLWLKKNNYKNLLINQIQENHSDEILANLICAYWEAGFTDPNDLPIFIPHLLSNNFNIALEAYTSIIGLDKAFKEEDINNAIQLIEEYYANIPAENIFMVDEVLEILKLQISSQQDNNGN